jgi:putative membrane protein insertion efficiency factor
MLKYLGIILVKFYQKILSPYCPGCCRFIPTCSNYCLEALRKYGLLKGIWLSALRILRCHPLTPSGYDPLP